MKRIAIISFVLCPNILHTRYEQSLWAIDRKRDFEYYKSKTIEILHALEVDSSPLKFTPVCHNPTVEEREANQNVVFFNVEKLNAFISETEALFECLVEAQLSKISPKEWDRITNIRAQIKLVPHWLPYVLLLPPICYIAAWIYYRPNFSVVREVPFAAFAAISMFLSVMNFYNYSHRDGYHIPVKAHIKNNFELKKLFIQIDIIHKLLNTYRYAPIAFQGMESVEWQCPKVETYGGYIDVDKSEIEDAFSNLSQAFERWKGSHPKAYAHLCEMSWSQYILEQYE